MENQLAVTGIGEGARASGQGTWTVDGDVVTGTAEARTDLFLDPSSPAEMVNAPRLLITPPDGDFQLSARVEVRFAGTFDAGVLLLWSDERTWAKLCFEYSPDGEPMVVSVVTRGVSDDANAITVAGHTVWLRVSRRSGAYAYHASTDGKNWQFVRHFSLGDARPDVGFEVQAPTGDGCTATFTAISFAPTTLADLRDGT
jgi:regulation of enolase protein 1 (concanavalin A-like superfamily)